MIWEKAQGTLIRQWRTKARKNTSALNISYHIKLFGLTWGLSTAIYPNQRNTAAEPSKERRKQRKLRPLADDKIGETFHEDLDEILKYTLSRDLHKKLSSLPTIVFVVSQEHYRTINTKGGKGEESPVNPIDSSKKYTRRTDINKTTKQYRKANEE